MLIAVVVTILSAEHSGEIRGELCTWGRQLMRSENKCWSSLYDFLKIYISVLILVLYCHVLFGFSWTIPNYLRYCCYHYPVKPVPVFSFFAFSKILGSTLPDSLNPFPMPPIFEFPVLPTLATTSLHLSKSRIAKERCFLALGPWHLYILFF